MHTVYIKALGHQFQPKRAIQSMSKSNQIQVQDLKFTREGQKCPTIKSVPRRATLGRTLKRYDYVLVGRKTERV